MRPVHRVVIRSGDRARTLCVEPWGSEFTLAPGEELLIELTGDDPPSLDLEDDRVTCWGGGGSEIRVLRGTDELFSPVGVRVPHGPKGMSVRMFLARLGLWKPSGD